MFKSNIISKFAAVCFTAASLVFVGPISVSAQGNSNAHNKVTICHATGSRSNPYVRITPNANGVINGHVGHQAGRDIIPPFTYNDRGTTKQFTGQNWNSIGQAIFNNGCRPVVITPPGTPPQNGGDNGGVVLSANTGGRGAGVTQGAQVAAPVGGVSTGYGSSELSVGAAIGLIGSLALAGFGARQMARIRN